MTVPGQERFLIGSTVAELKDHAAEGPSVIVNVTYMGADAILVSHSQVKHLLLPQLSALKAPQFIQRKFNRSAAFRNQDLWRDIGEDKLAAEPDQLSWLWTNRVELNLRELDTLGEISVELTRVWWIGSGIASSFPFHAAQGESGSCLDRVVSSYTPTIKALGYSRSRARSVTKLEDGGKASILIITMPTTPSHAPVKGAEREADLLLQGEKGVGVPVVHRLTISMISKVAAAGRARVAFLSACSSAEIKASKLGDEGLHLSSAFQVAGFASVIGSQWHVSDSVCVELARAFYTQLVRCGLAFSNRDVADALRSAMLYVRGLDPNNPDLWSPFVHCGA
ncbi:hypothetical protein PV08_03390 [Exophiala spinifera]|uniref:CHAT domain-containing protein n=1 Tax=Exophiala spinifera TaxID=91928 RepID=A0A0D2BJL8_9EURO|nr:uncharacterized protein PV08_03390 [Exophiala spinifera]KIW19098.1 hypothetical protein PV08_03390 [Exophiala spinifera]